MAEKGSPLRLFAGHYLLSGLMGLSLGGWGRLLRDNGFRVAPQYWPRAALITVTGVINSLCRKMDERAYGPRLAGVRVPAPIVILGHWRGGTTHLHQILALTPGLTTPTLCEVLYPHAFSFERTISRLLSPLLPPTRLIDPMPLGMELPQEEEFALAQLTLASPYLAYAFPDAWELYNRFLTFAGCTREETLSWQRGLDLFLRKLVLVRPGRPLLKSPASTGRLPLLLDSCPGIKMIHVSRHPYSVFASTKRMLQISIPFMKMQPFDEDRLDDLIIFRYRMMYDSYLTHRAAVPPGRLHEMKYEDLVASPGEAMESLFRSLHLPHGDEFKGRFKGYLKRVAGYRAQEHAPLSSFMRARLRSEWANGFDAWGYPS